ncbi:hypothetical protein GCM10020218_066090 [Dactylosporangium vinaceum]
MAHRGQQGADPDRAALRGGLGRAGPEPVEHCLDDLGQGQPGLQVLLGREADLGVHDPVGGQVQRALAGDPVQRVSGLHHRDGVGERLQVTLQRTRVRRGDEPLPEPLGRGGRQLVADLGREVQDRGRPQPAVQVVVEQSLGRTTDLVETRSNHALTLVVC